MSGRAKLVGTARRIGTVDWRSDAALYRVQPPIRYGLGIGGDRLLTEYVIVSAVDAMWTGPETYIFPATVNGDAINMLELGGSFRGALDHRRALRDAGYRVVGK